MIKIVGICGSPIKDSNTELLLREAIAAIDDPDVHPEVVTLHSLRIEDCVQCNWCMGKQSGDRFCSIEDDLPEVAPKVLSADAVLVASPVYLGRMSGRLASFLDRLRCLHYGKQYLGCMKHKVGAAIAVGWYRNSGVETTLNSIHWSFLTFQMVVAVPGSMSTFGGAGVSSLQGTGVFDPADKHQVAKDEHGLKTARATARSMLELARIIKAGIA